MRSLPVTRRRVEEMRQANRIVEQCLDQLPEGPIMAKRPRVLKAPKESEVYFAVEGPKGELGFYLVGDGTTQPWRCHVRPPSFMNLQSLPDLTEGHLISEYRARRGRQMIVARRSLVRRPHAARGALAPCSVGRPNALAPRDPASGRGDRISAAGLGVAGREGDEDA